MAPEATALSPELRGLESESRTDRSSYLVIVGPLPGNDGVVAPHLEALDSNGRQLGGRMASGELHYWVHTTVVLTEFDRHSGIVFDERRRSGGTTSTPLSEHPTAVTTVSIFPAPPPVFR